MTEDKGSSSANLTALGVTRQQLAAEYIALAKAIGGCGDGNCVVIRLVGMHTNGGCRCIYHMDRNRETSVMRLVMKEQDLARAVLEEK